MKGSMMTSGWSAVGGQVIHRKVCRCVADGSVKTRSPYVRGEVANAPFLGHSVSQTPIQKQTLYPDTLHLSRHPVVHLLGVL